MRAQVLCTGNIGAATPFHVELFRSRFYDPKAQVRRVPPLFAQDQSEDGQAPQPRHFPQPPGRREARARRAVFQAPRTLRRHLDRRVSMARNSRKRPRTAARRSKPTRGRTQSRYWSSAVTRRSNALDLESSVFAQSSPRKVALSLKRSAERSRRRKGTPYQ